MINYGEYCNLVDELIELAKAYSNGSALVDDVVYDTKYKQLKEFELNNPDLILPESPTQNVVEEHTDGFKKVEHDPDNPMVSITNANGIEEAVAWVADMHAKYGVAEFELEYKIDGASLELRYRNGILDDAVTRGQNNIGDSVVSNAPSILGVKTILPVDKDYKEIRGEVVWTFDAFDEFNERLEDEGKKPMANPRNGAAGSLKLTNPKEVACRKLSYIAYIVSNGSESGTHSGDIEWLESMGFEVPVYHVVNVATDGLEKFREVAESMREKRNELAYPIDGIVIKVNDKSLYPVIGRTNKAPNYYKAYKFPPEEKDVELLDIINSVGMSGAITPVAIVPPTSLAMTTVRRVSLHNWDVVEYLGLFKGCHVRIRKAGEIIPELVMCVETGVSKDDYEIITKSKNQTVPKYYDLPMSKRLIFNKEFYKRPSTCPFCGAELRNATEDAVAWVCPNPDCDAQIVGKLCKFVARNVMAIRGIGEAVIQNLYDAGKVKNAADLYVLTQQDFIDFCGCREKKADKLLAAIEKSKSNDLNQLLEGLGISGVGHVAAMALAVALHDRYGGLKGFIDVCSEPSKVPDGITDTVWANFVAYVKTHQEMLNRLVSYGVAQNIKRKTAVTTKLEGKVCIMTGTFDKLARDDFKNMVEANGGKICSSITKECNIVLMGDNAGPAKIQKIEKLKAAGQQIAVYTPATLDEFLTLVK